MSKPLTLKCPKSGEPILEYESIFIFPGYPDATFPKIVAQRHMTPEEMLQIVTEEIGPEMDGFFSTKTKKPFKARLRFDPDREYNGKKSPGLTFDFGSASAEGSPAKELDEKCPKTGKPIKDVGDAYAFGLDGLYGRKNLLDRPMSIQDYIAVLESPQGVEFDGFKSKRTGKTFAATVVFVEKTKFNAKPGFEFDF